MIESECLFIGQKYAKSMASFRGSERWGAAWLKKYPRNFRENYPLFKTSQSKLVFAHDFSMHAYLFLWKTSKKRSIHEVSKRWTILKENVHFPFWFYQFPRRWLQTWFIKGNYTYSKNQYHVSLFQQVAKNLHLYLISRKIP